MTSVGTPGNAWAFLSGRKPAATDRESEKPAGTPTTGAAAKKVCTPSPDGGARYAGTGGPCA